MARNERARKKGYAKPKRPKKLRFSKIGRPILSKAFAKKIVNDKKGRRARQVAEKRATIELGLLDEREHPRPRDPARNLVSYIG